MSIRYAILGAGAMGSVLGARLHLGGCRVELLNRSPQHPRAIAENGLLAHIDGNTQRLEIAASTVERASRADVVIIFTKTHQIDAALRDLPDNLRGVPVVTLQNGLGNAARVAERVGIDNTIEGVTMMPAEFIGPGEVASSDAAETWMYHASGKASELVDAIGADFNRAGITCSVTPEVHKFIWQKACFNIAMNALCALTGASPGMLQAYPDGNALAHEIVDESVRIAAAGGVEVDAARVHALIDYACANHTWHKPSMLQDLEHERLTEIEAMNGYIEQLADARGERAPLNRSLARLVRLRQAAPEFWRRKDRDRGGA